jgi:hypothetical protein
VAGQRFSSDIPEISETGRNILTEILLKVKTFSSDGSHLEFLIYTTILVKYNKMYILAKFACT